MRKGLPISLSEDAVSVNLRAVRRLFLWSGPPLDLQQLFNVRDIAFGFDFDEQPASIV
jgi:hypothetical protein